MPRPKEFDVETALGRALELFWRHGFDAASLKALLAAMGISRQSLYDTFGDKRGLYLRALERYAERRRPSLARLEAPGAGPDAIALYLRELVDFLGDVPTPRACMLTQASIEFSPDDVAIHQVAQHHTQRLELAFYRIVERALVAGTLVSDRDPARLSCFLTCTREGLSVMARAGSARRDLDAAVDVALDTLGYRGAPARGLAAPFAARPLAPA